MNPKLKAFTLLELIVVMLLFSIVIMIAYNSLLMVQQLYKQYDLKKYSQLELEEFIFQINLDFRNAKQIEYWNEELVIITPKDTATYNWDLMQVKRIQSGREDIYNYQLHDWKVGYSSENGVISTCGFLLTFESKTIEIIMSRFNDAQNQFKLKE